MKETKRHATMSSENLGMLVDAAKELNNKEEEQKQRDREAGRRNEIDDLPTGHPLRVMMEEAKKKYEAKEERTKINTGSTQKAVKTAKKITPTGPTQSPAHEEAHRHRVRSASNYNDAANEIIGRLDGFRSMIDNTVKQFHGFQGPHVKLLRANRAIVAACFALKESMITASERG